MRPEDISEPAPGVAPATGGDGLIDAAFGIAEAGEEMAARGLNPVMLANGQYAFEEWQHYPPGDARDTITGVQLYYHSHRGEAEHGHFHVFLRGWSGVEGTAAVTAPGEPEENIGKKDLVHVIAIAMDATGLPCGLFTCNRWVTNEVMAPADAIIPRLAGLRLEDAFVDSLANHWFSDFFRLYRDDIAALLTERDRALAAIGHALGDTSHEILSQRPVSLLDRFEALGLIED